MPDVSRNYAFDRTITREVLDNYLSRAISVSPLCESPQRDEDLRMLHHIGAKYVGRVAFTWGQHKPVEEQTHFANAARTTSDYHNQYDPETIFQACIFEAVYARFVASIPIPTWVFEAFDVPAEQRCFDYEAMLYTRGEDYGEALPWRPHAGNDWMRGYFPTTKRWHWMRGEPGQAASVPDMSKLETRMWFYYRARRYIDAGYEALHMGQVHLMAYGDPDWAYWWDLLSRVRQYANEHARRRLVLIDTHTHGIALDDGRLLFDLHSFPLRPQDVVDQPERAVLELDVDDAIYGRSRGGVTPSGWTCDALPYVVEFDNFGTSGRPGEHVEGGGWVWGCDEITWSARQPEEYRNAFLRYARDRVRELDPNGHLQMPGQRGLYEPAEGVMHYYANTRSDNSPTGFNQEQTIQELWQD